MNWLLEKLAVKGFLCLFFYVPVVIYSLVVIKDFISDIPQVVPLVSSVPYIPEDNWKEKYAAIIGAITFTAVLSNVSFRASSSSKDKAKAKILYSCGEHLFLATLLFSASMICRYGIERYGKVDQKTLEMIPGVINTVQSILWFPFFGYYVFGFIIFIRSYSKLLKTLMASTYKDDTFRI